MINRKPSNKVSRTRSSSKQALNTYSTAKQNDLNIIKEAWNEASNSLNDRWAINIFAEKNGLESNGLFYSPVDNFQKPYPPFYLEFLLKYNDDFHLEIELRNKHVSRFQEKTNPEDENEDENKIPECFNGFIEIDQQEIKFSLNNFKKITSKPKVDNVSELLNNIYDFLFPDCSNESIYQKCFNFWEIWASICAESSEN